MFKFRNNYSPQPSLNSGRQLTVMDLFLLIKEKSFLEFPPTDFRGRQRG
jgi:hypothetical protein